MPIDEFLKEIKKIVYDYEHENLAGAQNSFELLEDRVSKTDLLKDLELDSLFRNIELLIYEYRFVSLNEVKEQFNQTIKDNSQDQSLKQNKF